MVEETNDATESVGSCLRIVVFRPFVEEPGPNAPIQDPLPSSDGLLSGADLVGRHHFVGGTVENEQSPGVGTQDVGIR